MLSLLPAVLGVVFTAVLAFAAVGSRALTFRAGLVAAIFGSVIVVIVGFAYLALLVLFVVGSTLATRYRLEEKSRRHVQEGTHGERGVANVVAHILVPTALALTALGTSALLSEPMRELLYASALAFGASDTFASEFGVLAGRARSILGGRSVEAGTNGGVSGIGELFALLGGALTAVMSVGLFALFGSAPAAPVGFAFTVTAAGFLSCQVDSILGQTLENSGYLSKHSTNLLGMLSSVAIAFAVVAAFGGSV